MPEKSGKVPTRGMPNLVVKILGRMNPQMAALRLDLGRQTVIDRTATTTTLGWRPRAVEDTVTDTARALILKAALQ